MRDSLSSRGRATVRGTRTAALLLGLSVGLAAAIGPAQADRVGVAAAVNPDAFSNLSDTPNKQLNIGKSIFYNERINTTASGLVQVLLVDGSTFTVGPNSDLVIDKFVYDPRKKTGEMIATFSKGTMRFIGGKLSKNDGGVTVKSPAGALAIRGGMFQGRVSGSRGVFSFLYGNSLTYTGRNGQTQTVYESGYTLDLTGGTPTIRPTRPEDTQFFQKAFSGGGTVVVGGQNNQPSNNQPPLTETVSLQDLISDATATQIDSTLQQEENNDPPPNNNNTNNDPPPNNTETEPTTEPTQVTVRVLNPPGTFTAFPNSDDEYTTHEHKQGILGGDDLAEVDDFIHTFSIVNNRLVGTVSGLTDSFPGDEGPETGTISDAAVNFPAVFPVSQCDPLGICLVTDATITQDGEIDNYIGRFVGRQGFFAYHVAEGQINEDGFELNRNPETILAFGGKKHNFEPASGKVHLFDLTPDVLANSPAPFSSAASMPANGFLFDEDGLSNTSVSPLALLTKDSNPGSRDVWLQTSLYIGGTSGEDGYDQQSFVNIALGGISDGGLVGARRGGAQVDLYYNDYYVPQQGRESYAFTGDIASLASPDGDHFLGTADPNIVIGFDSTGTHNIGRDIPLDPGSSPVEDQSGATYHVGVGIDSFQPATQQGGQFQGYAAGMVESEVPTGGFANVVASKSANDFTIGFNETKNTLWANLTVFDVQHTDSATGSYDLNFGDMEEFENRSAYIDDQHYAAIESGAQVSKGDGAHVTQYDYTSATSYLVSGDQLNVTRYFPETFGQPDANGIGKPFCNDCGFIKWGAWGTRVAFGDGETPSYVDNVHLGWWVAGDITSPTALSGLANDNMSATYNGHAIGNVANQLNSDHWKTYVAAGDLVMTWDFAPRTGQFDITKFDRGNFGGDGLAFTGSLCAPGHTCNGNAFAGNHFGGNLSGKNLPASLNGLTGSAAGSFVNNGPNPARGIIGIWNVKATDYKATGIFAGSGIPGAGQ